jgi:CBS domain-containing protein
MSTFFNFDFPPFNLLSVAERDKFSEALDIGYFQEGEVLIEPNKDIQSLFILIKGIVHETQDGETLNVHGEHDVFGARWLIEGKRSSTFTVVEEALIYLLPAAVFEDILKRNEEFHSFFFKSIRDKVNMAPARASSYTASPLLATAVQKVVQTPLSIAANASMSDAARLMRDHATTSILVTDRQNDVCGLITSSKLRDSALIDGVPARTPVGDVCLTDLIGVDQQDPMSHAMITMVKHKINRVVVREGDRITGVLELTDLLSFLSNHSYLLFLQVERAQNIVELKDVVAGINDLVCLLHDSGTSVAIMTRLVSEVNQRVFTKLTQFIAPTGLLENTCLIIMGSEGRREQVLRTDQDNALIIRDGYDVETVRAFGREFSDVLDSFGFPPCPGHMMVSNPDWCMSLSDYKRKIFQWVNQPDEKSMIGLSAFVDAVAACGDKDLLRDAKEHFHHVLSDHDGFYAMFAAPIVSFDTPLGMFHRLKVEKGAHEGEMDLKKGGIFTIVHGARVLAIKHKIHTTNTLRRIAALAEVGVLDKRFSDDLIDAFEFLRSLKLKASFNAQGEFKGATNFVRIKNLHKLEKDLLKESLQLVKEFKNVVSHHFNLGHF